MPKLSLTKLTDRPGRGEQIIVKVGRRKAKPLDELAAKHGVDVPGEMLDGWVAKEKERLGNLDLDALIADYTKTIGRAPRSSKRKVITAAILKHLRQQVTGAAAPEAPKTNPEPKAKRMRTYRSDTLKRKVTVPDEASTAPEVATKEPKRARDPRLPVTGSILERVYKGRTLMVTVLDDGFEYEGKPYRSLSALAQAITGAKAINGHLFFRLGKYAKAEKIGN